VKDSELKKGKTKRYKQLETHLKIYIEKKRIKLGTDRRRVGETHKNKGRET
jgi:hypothetical protein